MRTVLIKAMGILTAAALVFALSSCKGQKANGDETETSDTSVTTTTAATSNAAVRTGSEGLSFTVTGDGECTLTGLGTCTDTAVSIPAMDDKGNVVVAIAAGAFESSRVSAIEIPETVIDIADGAFAGCTKLSYISVSLRNENYCSVDGVLYDAALTTLLCCPGARGDQTLTIAASVKTIAPYAFSDCTTLSSVQFGGTSDEWKDVDVGDDNAVLANAEVSYAKEDGK